MRKIFYSILTLSVMIVVASCQDDNIVDTVDNPVRTGDEIGFGTSLPKDGIQTRTVYGGPIDTNGDGKVDAFPVYWEDGDEIAIYCPQASMPANHLVNYTIGVSSDESSVAETVTKIGDAGLQWGSEDLHKFYAFYPTKFIKGTESTGRFELNLPVEQRPISFKNDGNGNYQAVTDPNYAIMYAYRGQKKSSTPEGTDIDLQFKPLSTILEIEITAPSNITEPVTLTNINVETIDGTPIVGDFTAQVYPGSDTEESYESTVVCQTNMSGVVTDNISVPCSWTNEKGEIEFVKLASGKKLIVRAFMISNETEMNSENIRISVATTGGVAHKTLKAADGTTFKILPHKVSRVVLPQLPSQYDVNYWMSSMDPDVYLTEVSIPGSKFTDDRTYQPTDVHQQYLDGVRAFILHTTASRRWVSQPTWDDWGAGYYDYTLNVNNAGTLKQSISDIASYLKEAETALTAEGKESREYAVVMVTYQDGAGGQSGWIDGLHEEVQEMLDAPETYRIYDKEVTANTTIGDVKGHIILKANVNSDNMVNTYGDPIMYSLWQDEYGPKVGNSFYQDLYDGMPLYWGRYETYDQSGATTAGMRWYYQELTTSSDDGSAEGYYSDKKTYISRLFQRSVYLYENSSDHNVWFMNDLGGTKTDVSSGTLQVTEDLSISYSNGIEYVAADLNQLAINELLKRNANAGLGVIFMNFANRGETGKKFQSDLIMQTVINNNFKFALRKKETSTTNQTYNATYINGGNAIGWD